MKNKEYILYVPFISYANTKIDKRKVRLEEPNVYSLIESMGGPGGYQWEQTTYYVMKDDEALKTKYRKMREGNGYIDVDVTAYDHMFFTYEEALTYYKVERIKWLEHVLESQAKTLNSLRIEYQNVERRYINERTATERLGDELDSLKQDIDSK